MCTSQVYTEVGECFKYYVLSVYVEFLYVSNSIFTSRQCWCCIVMCAIIMMFSAGTVLYSWYYHSVPPRQTNSLGSPIKKKKCHGKTWRMGFQKARKWPHSVPRATPSLLGQLKSLDNAGWSSEGKEKKSVSLYLLGVCLVRWCCV